MKISPLFCLLIFCFDIDCFTQNGNNLPASSTVQISLKITGKTQGLSAFVTKFNSINYRRDTLAGSKIDASGNAVLHLPLNKPTFAEIRIGNKKTDLYLSPGDDLRLEVDLTNPNFTFTGKGAEANNYLWQSAVIQDKKFRYKNQYINELNTNEFIIRLDTMSKALKAFHSRYVSKHPLPKNVSTLLKANNELFVLSFAQNYADAYFGSFATKDKMPPRLKALTNTLFFDTTLLYSGLANYTGMLDYYYRQKFYNPFFKPTDTPQKIDSIRHIIPQAAHANIQKSTFATPFKAFFLAKNIDKALEPLGIIPATESLLADFKTHYGTSPYLPVLQKSYAKWLSVAPGTTAPDFTGETPDGKQLSLSSLKGKVVYVDMWATWCGPCRAEFPWAKELKKQFEGNNEVVFLYASVDGDPNAWGKFLKTANSPEGIHIRLSPIEQRKISEEYQCGGGVPKYFLIDQQGKIVSTVAPRPSSGKAEEAIRALLK
ncbi:TlpA family protein disulfide reductase [Runella aurantiaca]|uniref:TlpA family protein disulfide reductase n=1 Tax=Runella aurantiaca TaxID=2282308 RepID=A0A369IJR6_9BACT|nr:TlpA disulfide reductase family protein [Runella aurantiaca]RDB07504.1 TlpA family protein disulfide reductase [Runella aurantiaca]